MSSEDVPKLFTRVFFRRPEERGGDDTGGTTDDDDDAKLFECALCCCCRQKQRKRNAIFEANASRDSSSSCFTASYLCAARMDAHARDDECGWEKHCKIRSLLFFLAAGRDEEREKEDTFSLVWMDLLEKSSQRILLSLLASARRTTFRGRERR